MQAFIKTLFEIITIRKGPEAIPYSWLLLNVATAIWFLPLFALVAVVQDFGRSSVALLVASWALSLQTARRSEGLVKRRLLGRIQILVVGRWLAPQEVPSGNSRHGQQCDSRTCDPAPR